MKILHITEALGGGVVSVLSQLAQAQAKDGHEVILLYSIRANITPSESELAVDFPEPVQRIPIEMVTSISPAKDVRAIIMLRRMIRLMKPDVVHLHSSKAGVLGGLAITLLGSPKPRYFYSPHGLSVLKQDVGNGMRLLYLMAEKFGAMLGSTFVACSQSEAEVARTVIGHRKVFCIENGMDFSMLPAQASGTAATREVIAVGRATYQKGPWRFAELAVALRDCDAHFIWIGSGELEHELVAKSDGAVEVKTWMPRRNVIERVSRAYVFVMTSLWEGMPVALIEAQACGVPAVVMDAVGTRDVVQHGVTGFVCKSAAELEPSVRKLLECPELRNKMGAKAKEQAFARFNSERMHRGMLKLYSGCEDMANH